MKNSLIGTPKDVQIHFIGEGQAIVNVTSEFVCDENDIAFIEALRDRIEEEGAVYISLEKPRKPKRHKKAKISGSKVVKVFTDDIAAGGERQQNLMKALDLARENLAINIKPAFDQFAAGLLKGFSECSFNLASGGLIPRGSLFVCDGKEIIKVTKKEESEGRIINMAIESGLATLCTGTGAVFPAMRDDVDIRAEVLEFARQVKALAVSEACFNEMLERHRNDTATPDAEVQEPKPSREALIDQFNKTHWVDNVGQGVSWRERELMKKAVLWAHGYKD